jgi:TRAP-type C4-dicarboxylate transport system permease large subunit
MHVAALIVVGVGVGMILLGVFMTFRDWKRRTRGLTDAERDSLGGALKGLAKLLVALKSYPTGQRLIVFGIVVLMIGGVYGGVSGCR